MHTFIDVTIILKNQTGAVVFTRRNAPINKLIKFVLFVVLFWVTDSSFNGYGA